jgi:hypothetical protein
MGLYFAGPGAYGDLLATVRRVKPPLVVVRNEEKAVADIKAASPGTFVVYGITGHDAIDNPSYEAGASRASWLLPAWRHIPADCFMLDNEWLSQDDPVMLSRGISACLGELDVAKSLGMEICVGNFNTGQPQLERPIIADCVRPLMRRAKFLNVHLYPYAGDPLSPLSQSYIMRRWLPLCYEFPHVRLIVGEYAPDNGRAAGDAFRRLLSGGDETLKLYPSVVGAALFTLRGNIGDEWQEYDLESELADYEQYVTKSRL